MAALRLEEARLDLRHGALVALHRLSPQVQELPAAQLQGQRASVLETGWRDGREGGQRAGGGRDGRRGGGDGVAPLGGLHVREERNRSFSRKEAKLMVVVSCV